MTRIFVILLSQDGFESDCLETKLETTTFYSQFEKQLLRTPCRSSGRLFPIKRLSISFPIRDSIKLPANICWSWASLQNFFSVTIFRLPRRLEDVLKMSCKYVLKKSWRRLGRWKIVMLKTSWRHVLRTSWGHLGNKQNFYWEYLYLTNLNLYLINLYLRYLYLTNQGEYKMY